MRCVTRDGSWTYHGFQGGDIADAIQDRITNANGAWEMLKVELISSKEVDTKLRLMLSGSLVSSVVLYSVNIVLICKNSTDELQQFHSKRIRITAQGYCNSDDQLKEMISR